MNILNIYSWAFISGFAYNYLKLLIFIYYIKIIHIEADNIIKIYIVFIWQPAERSNSCQAAQKSRRQKARDPRVWPVLARLLQ